MWSRYGPLAVGSHSGNKVSKQNFVAGIPSWHALTRDAIQAKMQLVLLA